MRQAAALSAAGVAPASLACWRSGVIRTTFLAMPTFSIAQMSIAEMSTSNLPRPWRAERGKAWWLWCQDSPKVGIASQATFVDLSSTSKRRLPK